MAADIDMEVKIVEKLQHFSEYRFPANNHEDSWIEARNYVEKEFDFYGLRVQKQTFNSTVWTLEGDQTVSCT